MTTSNIFQEYTNAEYLFRLTQGLDSEKIAVYKFGKTDITTTETVIEKMSTPANKPNYIGLSALPLRVKAGGNGADALAGTGAQIIQLEGLNSNYDMISEKISLKGASASLSTSKSFLRINRAYITQAGTGLKNAADIIIENTSGVEMIIIPSGLSQTQSMKYTVPNGYNGLMVDLNIYLDKAKEATCSIYMKGPETTDPIRNISVYVGIDGEHKSNFVIPVFIPEKYDLWLTGVVTTTTTTCSSNGQIVLVKK